MDKHKTSYKSEEYKNSTKFSQVKKKPSLRVRDTRKRYK